MNTAIIKIIICLAAMTMAVFSIGNPGSYRCPDVYLDENSSCYLDLVSDYSEVVPESEWGR